MQNQIDINQLNSFIENANQMLSCDSECQKNKTTQELKQKLLKAETNLILADPEFQIARQNYYTYVNGEQAYDEMMKKELEEKALLFTTLFKEKYDLQLTEINTQLNTYNSLYANFINVLDLYEQYKKENRKLYQELKNNTNDILTNDRKTYYENQQIDNLNTIYFYFLWTIYLIIVACYGVFLFIYPNTLLLFAKIISIAVFLVLPFIAPFLIKKILDTIRWIASFLPKNVYR